jgi:ABC-2 type transport system ATP-binding protein
MSAVIAVNNLSKKFSEIHAVSDLSFTVNKGDVYGFLGQNGAGKSTTIRMLLTLIKPTAGSIKIFEKDLLTHRHNILTNTGAVIEKPDLYKYLSAFDNLSIFAKLSGCHLTKKELMAQLEMVGLADRSDSKVKTFSQGMKQRLGIAVALVHNPELIILDEPTNGLDPQGIADMRNLIIQLSKERSKTILVSSHLLSEIELVANRMLIIHKGRKMAEGKVSELLDPAKTLVKVETADKALALQKIKQSAWANNLTGTDDIAFTIDKNKIPALSKDLIEMGVPVVAIVPQHSLENYFLSLTNQASHVEAFTN